MANTTVCRTLLIKVKTIICTIWFVEIWRLRINHATKRTFTINLRECFREIE